MLSRLLRSLMISCRSLLVLSFSVFLFFVNFWILSIISSSSSSLTILLAVKTGSLIMGAKCLFLKMDIWL